MKIAIVHDYLNQYGGAERVVEAMHEIFPDAPIFTSVFDEEKMPVIFKKMDIRTSFMQRFPLIKKHYKKYFLFYPKAIESFKLDEYDLIISSSSAYAKGAVKGRGAVHVCYCYSPMRFVWDYDNYIKNEEMNSLFKKTLPVFLKKLKTWDLASNKRVDYFIGISQHIKERIKRCYGLDSGVIYPPVNTEKFRASNVKEEYFLIVSRLNAYKNIDIVIEAFNKLDLKLKIVGSGPYRKKLEAISNSSKITFLGRVPEEELISLYENCRAFIFPGEEDFGIAPIEAQSAGKPVVAFARGGALETIISEVTGVFFSEKNCKSITDAINWFILNESKFSAEIIRENALRFDKEVFKARFKEVILKKYKESQS